MSVILSNEENNEALLDVLKSVDLQLSNPGMFCSASTDHANTLSELMRKLFKSSTSMSKKTFGPFQELLIDGYDGETIWEELQTRNRPLTKFLNKRIFSIVKNLRQNDIISNKENQDLKNAAKKLKVLEDMIKAENDTEDDDEDEDEEEKVSDDDNDEGEEEEGSLDEDDEDNDDDEDEDEGIDLDEDAYEEEEGAEGDDEEYEGGGDAEYEDIDKMQSWLDDQEEKEEKHEKFLSKLQLLAAQKGAVEEGPDSEDEEDDMLFMEREMYDDIESEGDNSDDNSNKKKKHGKEKKGSELKYEDFFKGGIPQSSSSVSTDKKRTKDIIGNKKVKKAIIHDDEEDDDDEEDGDNSGDDDEDDEDEDEEGDFDEEGMDDYDFGDDEESQPTKAPIIKRALTTHEKKNAKLATQIAQIESELIGDKPWDMKGEVNAVGRPENSLLEISAQIERASKSAPMATEEFTSSLEEMIIKRIREEHYDDVVMKEEKEDVIGESERIDLSQERSRVGLGEIYAEDFLAKATSGKSGAKDLKETAIREELKELYHKVCRQLDGLSHFHFTPKPVVSEARIFGSGPEAALPSLSLEDINPMSENTNSTILAPEEVKDKKKGRAAALMADEELSRDDKRRLRRAAKASGQNEAKDKDLAEKKMGKTNSAEGNKARRNQEEKKTDEVLRSDYRVTEGEENDNESYTKSAAFFSKLQQTAQQEIGGVMGKKGGKGKKRGFDPDAEGGPMKKASGFKL
eukprot:CAMPEP_0119045176 /NCGR_PEP_ID=MMETSP1177-20130426/37723_1 /TAXON_ID=2985 /ORGANISM="Ochromonas sp, Strain CCMP1899" /LENGTH=740 /DNA_ID=CAMNT_0007016493 /DNA_START=136 /DNA_END=2358 /DNA_ORIENTATION=-